MQHILEIRRWWRNDGGFGRGCWFSSLCVVHNQSCLIDAESPSSMSGRIQSQVFLWTKINNGLELKICILGSITQFFCCLLMISAWIVLVSLMEEACGEDLAIWNLYFKLLFMRFYFLYLLCFNFHALLEH